jgi:hypothetical protein
MKPLKLYKIEPIGLPAMHLAARSEEQAMQMYVTWETAHDFSGGSFSVEPVALEDFESHQQLQLGALLATSTEGIARYDHGEGWVIDTDGWASFDTDEMGHPGALMVFQMRDLTSIEALVLALDYERAWELFGQHLLAHGGDPDALMFRGLDLDQLEDDARKSVEEVLDLGREGLVVCDAAGQWAFVTPLGARNTLDDAK